MTTRVVAITSALFLARHVVAPTFNGLGRTIWRLLEGCKGTVPGGGAWRRQDQGLPQDAHQGPVRRVQGRLGQGRKRQGLCG